MTLEEMLEQKLHFAKQEYVRRQQYFLLMVNKEINHTTFEQNAISDLVAMLECKTRIKTIEEDLSSIKIYSATET